MKKTLAAVAVLGAFAGSALAADVQLYGIVDLGVGYNHIDVDGLKVDGDKDKFEMKSGQASGSRWGIKGTEDLGNGLTVGFILEDGFDADTGSEDKTKVMFNRESSLFLEGGFGKVAFGRIGSLNNGQSSWAKVGMINAFGTSDWGSYSAQVGNIMATAGQWDNMIAYQTPDFAFMPSTVWVIRLMSTARCTAMKTNPRAIVTMLSVLPTTMARLPLILLWTPRITQPLAKVAILMPTTA